MRRAGPLLILLIGALALLVDFFPGLAVPDSQSADGSWRPIVTKLGLDLEGGLRVEYQALAVEGKAPGPFPGVNRPTNNAGGLEGGVTNGEDLRITGFMKPISTLMKPLRSVDLATMTESPAAIERSDVCAVPAAAVVGEAMVAIVLADALIEKFGGDSVEELVANWRSFSERTAARFQRTAAPDTRR